jgi:deoxyadenosine/deoxycytidine kinase
MPSPIIISLEGNIGAGKSTLLEQLKVAHPEWTFVDEPVDEWMSMKDESGKSLLERYYDDTRRWAYTFQNTALLSRATSLAAACNKSTPSNVFIVERSTDADKNVFAKMLAADGLMTRLEFDLYTKWHSFACSTTPQITAYIHLDTPVTVCHQRIQKRARAGEAIEVEYLDKLDSYHFAWLRSSQFKKPVLRYDTYSLPKEQSTVKHVEEFIASLTNTVQ